MPDQDPKTGVWLKHEIHQVAAKTPEEFQSMVDAYFDGLWDERKFTGRDGSTWTEPFMRPPTMAGLALHLGTTRKTMLRYLRDEESPCLPELTRAVERVAAYAEEALYERNSTSGAQFSLRVNHKYGEEDRQGGAGFNQTVITPAPADTAKAIPLWNDDKD